MRRRTQAASALATLLLVVGGSGAARAEEVRAPAAGWQVAARATAAHQAFTAAFADPEHGYTAGYAGDTRWSADGGRTWSSARNESMCRFGLDLAGDALWSVGNGGEVRRSVDGGRTWEPVRDLPDPGRAQFASFLDGRTGWVASTKAAWATADGGRTWRALRLPPALRTIAAVALRTPRDGYLLDGAGIVYATADAGATWRARPLGLPRGLAGDLLPPMHALRFVDAAHAVAVVTVEDERREDRLLGLRSDDGGATWRAEEVPAPVGHPYLTHDGATLTLLADDGRGVAVLRALPAPPEAR